MVRLIGGECAPEEFAKIPRDILIETLRGGMSAVQIGEVLSCYDACAIDPGSARHEVAMSKTADQADGSKAPRLSGDEARSVKWSVDRTNDVGDC